MRAIDMFWMTNDDWWTLKDGVPVVKDDAPKEAKESYQNYLKQRED